MKKKTTNLWILFAINVFISLIILFVFMGSIILALYHLGLFDGLIENARPNPIFPFLFLIFISMLIAIVLALKVGRKILLPINDINIYTKEISSGNFDISIPNNTKILALKEMIDNLNLMIQELSSIETLRSDFLVNVSHEFKTPLASIEGYAQLLQNPNITKENLTEYSNLIIDSSKQLSKLVHDILKISKLENQEVIFDNYKYRLDEQIREVILSLESHWINKNINLNINLENINFYGSESLLYQVWFNLIDNAIKYSFDNGFIDINLNEFETYVEFTIKDNGQGIKLEHIKNIFDKFYQTDITRNIDGNGLGLSIVKRILDLTKNEITVSSVQGKYTVFIVKLYK